ncbi:hypothetical protein MAFF211271_39730 (plasmid) [Ralstonia syzygii subsp. indonesiensis]|nr:hypothetical protein MAFF211271_39730 [Ralstonia pseudosolanacearum]
MRRALNGFAGTVGVRTYAHTPAESLDIALSTLRTAVSRGPAGSQTLSLANAPILRLPDVVTQLTQLRNIHLADCDLRELPGRIGDLHQLESLTLYYQPNLTQLPASLNNLHQLQTLDLKEMAVTALPPLNGLSQLTTLSVSDTPLAAMPSDISALRNLQSLTVSRTNIGEVPETVGNLRDLKILDLNRNPNVEAVPASIGNLSNLEELKLNGCPRLRELPNEIGNLHNLKKLYLHDCSQLRSLPDTIVNLIPHLQRLDLRGCTGLRRVPQILLSPPNGLHVTLPSHLRPATQSAIPRSPARVPVPQPQQPALQPPALGQLLRELRQPELQQPAAHQVPHDLDAGMRVAIQGLGLEPAERSALRQKLKTLPQDWQQRLVPHIGDTEARKLVNWLETFMPVAPPGSNIHTRLDSLVRGVTADTPQAGRLRNAVYGELATPSFHPLDHVEGAYIAGEAHEGILNAQQVMALGLERAEWDHAQNPRTSKQNYLAKWKGLHAFTLKHDPLGVVTVARAESAVDKLSQMLFQSGILKPDSSQSAQPAVLRDGDFQDQMNAITKERDKQLAQHHTRIANLWLHPAHAGTLIGIAENATPTIRKALDDEDTAPLLLDAIEHDEIVNLILKNRPVPASTVIDPAQRSEALAEMDTGFVASLADRYRNLAKAVLGPEASAAKAH